MERVAIARRGALTARNWGSDADLAGDLGLRLGPELRAQKAIVPRPGPVASPLAAQAKHSTPNVEKITYPSNQNPAESVKTDINSGLADFPTSSSKVSTATPRQASFFDIGGPFDDDGTPTLPRYQTPMHSRSQQSKSNSRHHLRTEANEFVIQHSKKGVSNALLQDIGGLFSSEPQGTPYSSSLTTEKISRSPITQTSRIPHWAVSTAG